MNYTCVCCGVKISPLDIRNKIRAHEHEVSSFYSVSIDLIKSPTRASHVVEARHELWYRMVALEGRSSKWAANWTGHDHSSVLYGVKHYAGMLHGTPRDASLKDIRQAAQAPLLKLMEEAA